MIPARIHADPDTADRTDGLLYEEKWRRTLLATLPLGVVAFMVAWLFETPGGAATGFDAVMYPILAGALVVLASILTAGPRVLAPVLTVLTGGLAAFFAAKLAWILFVMPDGVNLQAQMTENFFWIPVIYLLSFVLPEDRVCRRIALAFTIVILVIGAAYAIPAAQLGRDWAVVSALMQLNLANAVLLGLTSAFIAFREDYARTLARMAATERFAYTDPLTGLPNRHHLQRHLDQRLADENRAAQPFALLFVDLDSFKVVNDSLGHAGGDELLQRIAERMQSAVRGDDLATRISGDEFVMVLDQAATLHDATRVARRLIGMLAEPFCIRGHTLRVSISVGISLFPDDAQDVDTLLRHADSAMYRVKRSGRNGVQHFQGEADEKIERQRLLERDLRNAVDADELSLAFQSMHDLRSGDVRGFEALLRWRHPTWGDVAPMDLIPIAEQSGLIVPIGAWVLNEACGRAARWREESGDGFRVSVNVSPLQFSHPTFYDTVVAALDANALPAALLELELTETIVMHDLDRVSATLTRLQKLGIRIAIDDFGTGYSSLAYLRDLPIDAVKVDRSFVRDLTAPDESHRFARALMESIVSLAAHLDLEVVAEGVETDAQAELVRELGCRTGQGYRFSRPMPPERVAPFLAPDAERVVAAG